MRLVCRELDDGGLENTRSFIVMDVIYTLVRVLSASENGKYLGGGGGGGGFLQVSNVPRGVLLKRIGSGFTGCKLWKVSSLGGGSSNLLCLHIMHGKYIR